MKECINRFGKAHLVRAASFLALVVASMLLAFLPLKTGAKFEPRTLTFADRVAYQRAIEEVYWRHRIWPKENADPKPALDAVMSQAQLEEKVEAYLQASRTFEDKLRTSITAQQLQAEMDRMASDTKQPEVLRELFEVLGNDPFVIAECLARLILVERDFVIAETRRTSLEDTRAKLQSERRYVDNASYVLPTISDGVTGCTPDNWSHVSTTNAPDGRFHHTAVWTGSEMIIWGGYGGGYLSTGGRYNPSTDSWTATSTTDAPNGRFLQTAVWTGSEMIVWGGYDGSALDTGGRYNPTTDSWTTTSTTNAACPRYYHTAVWTGTEMIVWGGDGCISDLNTGGRYNPGTDSWAATGIALTGRNLHTAVWTGNEMIVWGGFSVSGGWMNTGGRYNPTTDSWTFTSSISAPGGRDYHTAVWTGSEMIVWGGYDGSSYLNSGGRYNLGTDSWTATSLTNAPSPRYNHTAVLTGGEMIVWGGQDFPNYFNTGGSYNPNMDSWTATSTTNAPGARFDHTAVWTDTEMIVWGGRGARTLPLLGARYCAQSGAPTPTPTATSTIPPRTTPTPRPRPTQPLRQ